mmetsp:Transcript_7604/g.17451  ORF Transcript_7604/g.17451 Transcript_7604/m.17451 type:complete len:162 (-) Transcript_7604:584-1069(-)
MGSHTGSLEMGHCRHEGSSSSSSRTSTREQGSRKQQQQQQQVTSKKNRVAVFKKEVVAYFLSDTRRVFWGRGSLQKPTWKTFLHGPLACSVILLLLTSTNPFFFPNRMKGHHGSGCFLCMEIGATWNVNPPTLHKIEPWFCPISLITTCGQNNAHLGVSIG